MTNTIIISGNIGSDPEVKDVKNYKLTTFSLAHTPRKKQGDQWVDGDTIWFRVILWGDKGEAVAGTYRKGSPVHVIGAIAVSNYTTKDGVEKTSIEINASEVLANTPKPARSAVSSYEHETAGW